MDVDLFSLKLKVNSLSWIHFIEKKMSSMPSLFYLLSKQEPAQLT